jgi:hypothetical protein
MCEEADLGNKSVNALPLSVGGKEQPQVGLRGSGQQRP